VTPDMVRAWHSETLTQDVPVIVVTGAINASDAGQAVDTMLGQLPERAEPEPQNAIASQFRSADHIVAPA